MIPATTAFVLLWSLIKGVDVFPAMTTGARNGLKTVFGILPALVALLPGVYMLRASGAVDAFAALLTPLFSKIGIPAELLPLMLLRPLTGSGALAIVLAAFFPHAQVVALDRSQPALEVARKNVQANGVQDRVALIASNWFENVEGSFDCIVANPPYLSEADWVCAQPEVKQFEPRQALVAADNGLSDLKQIIQEGYDHLNSDGVMVMETGLDQHHALEACARSCGYKKMQSTLDLSHCQRYFWLWTNA